MASPQHAYKLFVVGDHNQLKIFLFDLFSEVKKMRNYRQSSANKIDDQTENKEDHFARIYSKLYNSVDDKEELIDISKDLYN